MFLCKLKILSIDKRQLLKKINKQHDEHVKQETSFIRKSPSVWCKDIDQNLCKTFSDSMHRRIENVIKNDSFPTKYYQR